MDWLKIASDNSNVETKQENINKETITNNNQQNEEIMKTTTKEENEQKQETEKETEKEQQIEQRNQSKEVLERKRYLVVDTNAIIKGVQIDTLTNEVYTISEVLSEVKDTKARNNLAMLNINLKLKEPDQDSIKKVAAFAKKTGDLIALSKADLKVIALTYMLEKELKGVDHLRTEPINQIYNYDPNKKGKGISQIYKNKEGRKINSPLVYILNFFFFWIETKTESIDTQKIESSTNIDQQNEPQKKTEGELSNNSESKNTAQENGKENSIDEKKNDINFDESTQKQENKEDNNEEAGEWITPDNYHFKLDPSVNIPDQIEDVYVACITSDFAMQNVILQMGLNLLSTKGMAIKRVRQTALKCFACET